MSQHDFTVDNGAGVAVRADINLALKALASQSSGASAPSPTFPAQVWADTGTGRLKQRDAANANWVDKGPIDGAMAPLDSPVFTGQPQGNFPCLAGEARAAKMVVTTASTSATLSADEIVVKAALGGLAYRIPSFSKTINLAAANGAGGMDTGSAPVSGYVALYAIYNPLTTASALLAVNATSSAAPQVYGGANMPTGYTASGLVSVWRTNASSQFSRGAMRDRKVSFDIVSVLSTSTQAAVLTSFTLSAFIPLNAVRIGGTMTAQSTVTSGLVVYIAADNLNIGMVFGGGVGTGTVTPFWMDLITPQTAYYIFTSTAGSPGMSYYVSSYEF